MADMHVLDGDGLRWRIAMHFAVPDANNAVAVNYRTALVNSGLGGSTVLTEGPGDGQITAVEKALVVAGEVYEHLASFLVESGGTATAELRASLRQFYSREKAAVIADLQRRLRYFGHTESEG
ncbi:MAG: hypothetical protein GY778_13585 [bacterium]|nr:hypothetical protein [bacterium]